MTGRLVHRLPRDWGGAMTGTWTTAYLAALAAAEDALPFFPPPRRFAGQTVRQRVRLRRGGRAARLALSNEYGRDGGLRRRPGRR